MIKVKETSLSNGGIGTDLLVSKCNVGTLGPFDNKSFHWILKNIFLPTFPYLQILK